jgi:uncharacterized membrane protein YfcA
MEILLGFVIALMISLTGVGAGSMTTPLLILLLGVAPPTAVGTALTFGAVVKIASVPVYALRRQVDFRILRLLLSGGLPGVLGGALLMDWLKGGGYSRVLYMALGGLIVSVSLFHLYRLFRPQAESASRERPNLLWSLAFPIGAEVGFSSAGAGALGSLLLLSFTRLTAAEVVGTDLCFGLGLSAVGSLIQVGQGNFDGALLAKLVIGGLCGAFTGTLLAGRVAQRPLRAGLLIMLVILGFQLATHNTATASAPHPVLQAKRR